MILSGLKKIIKNIPTKKSQNDPENERITELKSGIQKSFDACDKVKLFFSGLSWYLFGLGKTYTVLKGRLKNISAVCEMILNNTAEVDQNDIEVNYYYYNPQHGSVDGAGIPCEMREEGQGRCVFNCTKMVDAVTAVLPQKKENAIFKGDLERLKEALPGAKDSNEKRNIEKAIDILKECIDAKEPKCYVGKANDEATSLARNIVDSNQNKALRYKALDLNTEKLDLRMQGKLNAIKNSKDCQADRQAFLDSDIPIFANEVKERDMSEMLANKILACVAAYKLSTTKIISSQNLPDPIPIYDNATKEEGQNYYAGDYIETMHDCFNNKKTPKCVQKSINKMAKESMRKRVGKIYLVAFVVSMLMLLASALFVGYWKDDIMYDVGNTLVSNLDGIEYEYRMYDDSGAVIVSAKADTVLNKYIVPQMIDGHNVVAIGEEAYLDCNLPDSIWIHDSIKSIGGKVFAEDAAITIYCEAQSKPDGWVDNWANGNAVVWGQ